MCIPSIANVCFWFKNFQGWPPTRISPHIYIVLLLLILRCSPDPHFHAPGRKQCKNTELFALHSSFHVQTTGYEVIAAGVGVSGAVRGFSG
jgi:hypothetical protein